jgi:hypothetical protein
MVIHLEGLRSSPLLSWPSFDALRLRPKSVAVRVHGIRRIADRVALDDVLLGLRRHHLRNWNYHCGRVAHFYVCLVAGEHFHWCTRWDTGVFAVHQTGRTALRGRRVLRFPQCQP